MAASSRRVAGSRSMAPNTPARVRLWRPTMTFSSALMLANRRMFWKVRAMPASTTVRLGAEQVAPLKRNWPSSGGYRPVSTLNSVVLPAPLGPIRP
jgi:hypothetical protein